MQRMVGAIFVIALGVIFIPYFLDGSPQEAKATLMSSIPVPPPAPLVADIPPANPQHVALPKPFEPTPTTTASVTAPKEITPVSSETIPVLPVVATQTLTTPAFTNDQPWTIQVGVYIDAFRAMEVEKQLRAKGYAAYRRTMPNTSLTQLFIGPEYNKEKARTIALQLQQELRVAALIVPFNDSLKVALQNK